MEVRSGQHTINHCEVWDREAFSVCAMLHHNHCFPVLKHSRTWRLCLSLKMTLHLTIPCRVTDKCLIPMVSVGGLGAPEGGFGVRVQREDLGLQLAPGPRVAQFPKQEAPRYRGAELGVGRGRCCQHPESISINLCVCWTF